MVCAQARQSGSMLSAQTLRHGSKQNAPNTSMPALITHRGNDFGQRQVLAQHACHCAEHGYGESPCREHDLKADELVPRVVQLDVDEVLCVVNVLAYAVFRRGRARCKVSVLRSCTTGLTRAGQG